MLNVAAISPSSCDLGYFLAKASRGIVPISLIYPPRTSRLRFAAVCPSSFGCKRNFSLAVLIGRRRGNYAVPVPEEDTDDSDVSEGGFEDDNEANEKKKVVPSATAQNPNKSGKDVERKKKKEVFAIIKKGQKDSHLALVKEDEGKKQKKSPTKRRRAIIPPEELSALEEEAPELTSGVRVLVFRLPKKKNILKDFFRVFMMSGIFISPAQFEDTKTGNFICRGFAFVDLRSVKVANNFMKKFSGRSFTFGGLKRRITCKIHKVIPADCESEPPAVSNEENEQDNDLDSKSSVITSHETDDWKKDAASSMSRMRRKDREKKKQQTEKKAEKESMKSLSANRKLESGIKSGRFKELGDGTAGSRKSVATW